MFEIAIQKYLERNHFTQLKPKAVFFDMDGVLFDSMPAHAISWDKVMKDNNLPFSQKEAYLNEGQPGLDTINHVFLKAYGRESTEEERAAIYVQKTAYFDEIGESIPMPFSLDVLKKLKAEGFKLFVVTGSAQPLLLDNIETYFPGIFEKGNVISAFDVERGKPFPDPYLKALKKADAAPWEAVVIENAPLGVKSSSSAQIFTIGVNTGPLEDFHLSENGADVVLDSIKELFEKWDNFGFSKK